MWTLKGLCKSKHALWVLTLLLSPSLLRAASSRQGREEGAPFGSGGLPINSSNEAEQFGGAGGSYDPKRIHTMGDVNTDRRAERATSTANSYPQNALSTYIGSYKRGNLPEGRLQRSDGGDDMHGEKMTHLKSTRLSKVFLVEKGEEKYICKEISALQGLESKLAIPKEIELLKLMRGNPHVVQYLNHWEDHFKTTHIILEYLGAYVLEDFVNENELRKELIKNADVWMAILIVALESIHKAGIIHGDVSLSNIIFDSRNSHLKFIDLGLSRRYTDLYEVSKDGKRPGNWKYMAPELIKDPQVTFSPKNDWFALGIVFKKLLLGDVLENFPGGVRHKNNILQVQGSFRNGQISERNPAQYPYAKAINCMTNTDMVMRCGAEELKKDSFFKNINWEEYESGNYKTPVHFFKDGSDQLKDEYERKKKQIAQ